MAGTAKLNELEYNELKFKIFKRRIRIPRSPHKSSLTFNQLETSRTNNRTDKMFKLIESYDAGGDLTKEWYVKYHFLIPDVLRVPGESEWQRFKTSVGINHIQNKTERLAQLKIVKRGIKKLLLNGFNPFIEFNLCRQVSYSGYSIIFCIDKYLEDIKPNLKPNTHKKYASSLSLFKKWLFDSGHGSTMIFNANKELVYNFIKHHQVTRKWSNKTFNHYMNSLNAFFQYYHDNYDDYVTKNPCKNMKRLKPVKKGNRPFDNYEFKMTMDHLRENNPVLYNFCRFVYYSCMRPDAEARMIRISDIDMIAGRIRIGSEITKGTTTQIIPIDHEFAKFLESMKLHKYPRSYYVFGRLGEPGPEPAYMKYFGFHFRKAKLFLGLHVDVTLYAFKHTRVIHMVEDGEKLHNIIKFTRHLSLANLMDYLKDMGIVIGETKDFKSRAV